MSSALKPGYKPIAYGTRVRVRATFGPVQPFVDLIVERRTDQGLWCEVGRFNDEDDMVMVKVDQCARRAHLEVIK